MISNRRTPALCWARPQYRPDVARPDAPTRSQCVQVSAKSSQDVDWFIMPTTCRGVAKLLEAEHCTNGSDKRPDLGTILLVACYLVAGSNPSPASSLTTVEITAEEVARLRLTYHEERGKGAFMADNKNPNQKQPGEKEPGTFHYNPGNMSGKTADTFNEGSERQTNADGKISPASAYETERGQRRMEATVNPSTTGIASSRPDFSSSKEGANDAVNRGKEAAASAASSLANNASNELEGLRKELNSLKETVSRFLSQAGDMSASVATKVSDAASGVAESSANLASTATDQAKSFASEVENMGRRNPLGAMAAALLIGVLIGVIGRGRNS
jgi:ElaB/YqjD/DUF883 family membrane-anchored ribosome-binding protein